MNINFSKPVTITYNDKKLKFGSVNKCINWIFNNVTKEYSKDFIVSMFNSGETNVNNWNQDHINYEDIQSQLSKEVYPKDMQDRKNQIITNKRNIKLYNLFKNSKLLIQQSDIYGHDFYFYSLNRLESIDEKLYDGICLLTSTYNAYPRLFNYNPKNLVATIKDLGIEKFDKLPEVIKDLNNQLGDEVFEMYMSTKNGDIEWKVHQIIDENLPVVLSISPDENHENNGHCVTLLGYTEQTYYIYDNADNTFEKMLEGTSKYKSKNNIARNGKFIQINKRYLYNSWYLIDLLYMNPKFKLNINNKFIRNNFSEHVSKRSYLNGLTERLNTLTDLK